MQVAAANPLNLRLTTRTARGTETLTASAPSASRAPTTLRTPNW